MTDPLAGFEQPDTPFTTVAAVIALLEAAEDHLEAAALSFKESGASFDELPASVLEILKDAIRKHSAVRLGTGEALAQFRSVLGRLPRTPTILRPGDNLPRRF